MSLAETALEVAENANTTIPRVAARWRESVERGTPVLVTQAGAMSRPILTRVGFHEVCEIRILADRF